MKYDGLEAGRLVPLLMCLLAIPAYGLASPLSQAPAFIPAEAPSISPVSVSLAAESPAIVVGKDFTVDLVFDIDPDWHVYGPPSSGGPGDTGLPTTIAWDLPPGFSALPIKWPKAEQFSLLGVDSEGYSGKLVLRAKILASGSIGLSRTATIKAKVEWLACRIECMPGQAKLELTLPVAASSRLPGILLALILAFAGGLTLNLMPCVLPVLSLKALALARRGLAGRGAERRSSLSQGLLFTAGVLVSFWILAAVLLILRSGGRAIGWGFQLQAPGFVVAAAIAFFLIGLNLFGVFEVGLGFARWSARAATTRGRTADMRAIPSRGSAAAVSSFLSGLFATAVATPCTAPFMGPAIGYALSQDAYAGSAANAAMALGVFTALGLGMAAPLLVVSALPGLARRLPKAGGWMIVLRQALGFPMMATVVWMAFVLSGLAGSSALVALLEGLLAAALGAWAWGNWGRIEKPWRVRIVAAFLAVALVAGAFAWTLRAFPPSTRSAGASGGAWQADSFWRPWSEGALAELRTEGRPVFVDFTAAWCLSCQVNEAVALNDGRVRGRFAQLGVAALKADWTAKDEAIGRALSGLGRASVPLYALYVPGRAAPVLLPEILTPAIVLRSLDDSIAKD